jgi:outer membrane protein TolC
MRRITRGALFALCVIAPSAFAPGSARAQANAPSTYPIDLPTALRLADAQNLDVQVARERLKEALANRTSAIEQFIPWLAPGVTWHRRDGVAQASPSGIIGKADYVGYSPGVGVNAQSALGDAIYNSLATKQLVRASDEGLAALRLDAAAQAANGYFDLAKAKALVEVVRDALATSQDYQKQLHDAVDVGIAFKGDELRVQAQSQHYQVVLRQALAQQRVAAVDLARVLHLDASVELVPQAGDLVPITLFDSSTSVESLLGRATQSRPELKQTEALIAAGRTARDAAVYGPLIPTVGAQFFGGWLGGGPDSASRRVASMRDYALAITWRIGPGGLFDRGRIDASKAQLATRELNETKLKDAIAAEVVADLTRIRSLSDQIALAEMSLGTATQALQLTRDRKQFGVGIVLEDIQAQQAVTQARSDYITAVAEFDKAQYALNKAVGGGPAGTPTRQIPP